MKTPFTRRAEAFAAALDRVTAGGTAEPAAAAVAPLVHLAARLAALPQRPVGMSPGFRAQLVSHAATPTLLPVTAPTVAAQATSAGVVSAATGTAGQIVAGVLAAAVAVTGVGAAAARSKAGDPFYGLRGLAGGDRQPAMTPLGEADRLAGEAAARLAELRRLLASGELDAAARARIDQLIAELSRALDGVLDRLSAEAPPEALLDEVTRVWNELADLVPALPPGTQRAVLDTLSVVNNRLGAAVDGASPVSGPSRAPSATPTTQPSSPQPTTSPSAIPSSSPSTSSVPLPTGPPGPLPSGSATPTTLPVPAPPATDVPAPVVPLPELPSQSYPR
ncbi:MAG TPA: hypothetical protein VNA12_03350 [Mycobacteriales bacterium]|nr:hypothetical protein [Mycobacteriales bacterium]